LFITAAIRIATRVLPVLILLIVPSLPTLGARVIPLPAPVLTSHGGRSPIQSYLLKGTVDTTRPNSWVRILRNGTVIDSVSAATDSVFSAQVPLLVGDNLLRARLASGTSVSVGSNTVKVTFDIPVLLSPGGKSHTDTYLLKGEIDQVLPDSWVRIFHNGTLIDSLKTSKSAQFSKRFPLFLGDNSFQAVFVAGDSVKTDSSTVWRLSTTPPSNIVNVQFVNQAGFFIPVPMLPGDSFDVNPVQTAAGVHMRIFDPAGDLVIKFESREARDFYTFPWDGKNGSYQSVRRGLLVAVGAIDYPDGTHEVVRKAFLFDPEGRR
jgi:hypothetical protein